MAPPEYESTQLPMPAAISCPPTARMVFGPPQPPRADDSKLDCLIRVKYQRARAAQGAKPRGPKRPQCWCRMHIMGEDGTRGTREQALHPLPHQDHQGGGEGGIRSTHLPEPSARPREGVNDRGRGGEGTVQARHVVGDVIGGGGEVVEPPLAHVGNVANSMPFAVVRGPRGEGGAPEGQDVPVLTVRVPRWKGRGKSGESPGSSPRTRRRTSIAHSQGCWGNSERG